jgi:hypothetical protein
MKRYFFQLLFILSALMGCRSMTMKSEVILNGLWAIDSISLLNKNVMWNLSHNLIAFEDDNKCILPQFDWQGYKEGNWNLHIKDGKINLDIKSIKSAFNRNYEIIFFDDDKRKLHCMKMKSDSMVIVCSKGLTVYRK